MTDNSKSLIYVHAAIFLFGFSALFARLVDQSAVVITFGRVLFSSMFLLIFLGCRKLNFRLNSRSDYLLIFAAGIILAVHWFCFIQSIQLSTVAIGTITFSTFPVFTSFLEPVFFKGKIKIRTIVCALIMLAGVFIVCEGFNTPPFRALLEVLNPKSNTLPKQHTSANRRFDFRARLLIVTPVHGDGSESGQRLMGIVVGLVSALTFAVLSLLNRRFSAKYRSEIIVFYEQGTAAIFLLPFIFLLRPIITVNDVILLAVLGIVFTAIAHGLFVKGLRHVEVSTAGIISGLEAVYAIILASVLLREIPALNEVAGGLIVIIVAGYMTLFRKRI